MNDKSNIASAQDIRPLHAPKDIPHGPAFYLLWAAVIIALIAATVFFLRRRKKRPPAAAAAESCDAAAYRALEALRAKDYPRRGLIKEFYGELSDIVRTYIEQRFNIRAPEMTTEEFLYYLKDNRVFSYEDKSLLREFLSACDLVKFARHRPQEEDIERSFLSAKDIIDKGKV